VPAIFIFIFLFSFFFLPFFLPFFVVLDLHCIRLLIILIFRIDGVTFNVSLSAETLIICVIPPYMFFGTKNLTIVMVNDFDNILMVCTAHCCYCYCCCFVNYDVISYVLVSLYSFPFSVFIVHIALTLSGQKWLFTTFLFTWISRGLITRSVNRAAGCTSIWSSRQIIWREKVFIYLFFSFVFVFFFSMFCCFIYVSLCFFRLSII
jgi:hypothetical protein